MIDENDVYNKTHVKSDGKIDQSANLGGDGHIYLWDHEIDHMSDQ